MEDRTERRDETVPLSSDGTPTPARRSPQQRYVPGTLIGERYRVQELLGERKRAGREARLKLRDQGLDIGR